MTIDTNSPEFQDALRVLVNESRSSGDVMTAFEKALNTYEAAKRQPIETAPRDGTLILALYPNDWPEVLKWDAADCNFVNSHYNVRRPTHWQTLTPSA